MSAVMTDMPRVLVVDDSAVIRQAIHKMLRSDFDLVLASDGEAGWEKLSQDEKIGVLITDIEMPRLDGYAFICRVRAADDPRIRDIPIITITGAEDEETKARAYACGATDFITKPLNAGQLQARVQAYLADSLDTAATDSENDVDELTRLYSRKAFVQQGRRLFPAHGTQVALIHLAIDGFRKLYRQHGDDVADRILTWAAKQIMAFGEGNALVARVGGSEFALLLPQVAMPEAAAVAERIRSRFVESRFADTQLLIGLTVSVGLALPSAKVTDFDRLMQLADQRLRYAESKGGNQVAVSGLEDMLPSPEELVLAAAPERPDAEEPPLIAALATDELEQLAKREEVTAAPRTVAADLVSLDRLLALLEQGREERVLPYLNGAVAQCLPLLRLYARRRRLDEDVGLSRIQSDLDSR